MLCGVIFVPRCAVFIPRCPTPSLRCPVFCRHPVPPSFRCRRHALSLGVPHRRTAIQIQSRRYRVP
ncbi:hypothetical protein DENSPDRAFT_882119 [Dentipellis sp. KUC8613]|nr:hypothetical protein DENSPDRAFT_882119 [Dentipellis sp. KUC8613]